MAGEAFDYSSRPDDAPPPARAAVMPRVHLAPGGAAVSLEGVIRKLLDSATSGRVLLLGRAGGGKSTALAHLRAVLPVDANTEWYDEPPEDPTPRANVLAVVARREEISSGGWLMKLELAPWGEDDWIEYCASRRRDQCSAVLARLHRDDGRSLLKGSPQLWRIVLDRLAADETVPDCAAALREHLGAVLPAGTARDRVAALCAAALCDEDKPIRLSSLPNGLSPYEVRLLRHRAVRVILAADLIAAKIAAGGEVDELTRTLPAELLRETACVIRWMPAALLRLDQMLAGRGRETDAMAASILLTADPTWRPKDARGAKLDHAKLSNAAWANVDLRGAELRSAELREADLSGANLKRATCHGADFRGAKLIGANLHWLFGNNVDLTGADLTRAVAAGANLSSADLVDADLRDTDLTMAELSHANLKGARLIGTNLEKADLSRVNLEEADLIGAKLEGARFTFVRFCVAANVSGVSFRQTILHKCEFEDMRLPAADFFHAELTGSYLTGSFIPRGNFRGANLRETGLAEIDWEDADLRDADLRGCTFHMGSTRSGLVGSTIPCEGSRTGFYTDDFADRDFKPPEEIRKANLCGADLRGANIENVDFYLVDLRGAKYSYRQREHLERCGAILDSHVSHDSES